MSSYDSKVDRHWLVFTGHRIDAPGRAEPRFPRESEPGARESILHAVEDEISRFGREHLRAISSGASGGDIIFLESCAALEIPAEIYLALNPDEFARASVADAGADWIRRFDALCARFPVHVLKPSPTQDLNVWQQTNLWMLETAFGPDGSDTTVIALWDGQEGDGDGGTKDMVDRAREAGARVVRIDLPKAP